MFNLFISNGSDSWDSSPYEWNRSRAVKGYTADEISKRYQLFGKNAIKELKSFPSLFVTENETTQSKIGYITDIRVRSDSVVIGFEFDPILPVLPIGAIEAMRVDIDLGKRELSNTHWAVKDEPIFDILLRHKYLNQQQIEASQKLRILKPPVVVPAKTADGNFNNSQTFIVTGGDDEITKFDVDEFISSEPTSERKVTFSPKIFDLPSEGVDSNLVSVMMPFTLPLGSVYGSIQSAAEQQNLVCKRADDIWDNSIIIQDIFSLIFRSFIVVCDFSGQNPNVFYEAGIAHTLGKHVIPITQSEQDIPFNLRHHKYIKYLNNSEGLGKLQESLSSKFSSLLSARTKNDIYQ